MIKIIFCMKQVTEINPQKYSWLSFYKKTLEYFQGRVLFQLRKLPTRLQRYLNGWLKSYGQFRGTWPTMVYLLFEHPPGNAFDMIYNCFYILFQKISVLHCDCFISMKLFVYCFATYINRNRKNLRARKL